MPAATPLVPPPATSISVYSFSEHDMINRLRITIMDIFPHTGFHDGIFRGRKGITAQLK
jgi:hypothetical protein